MTTRHEAIEAAARALLGLDASDIGSDPRADLRAALALPDAPAPASSERGACPTCRGSGEIFSGGPAGHGGHATRPKPCPTCADAPAPAPSERERALVMAAFAIGACEGSPDHPQPTGPEADEYVAEALGIVNATHPPTDAPAPAAGERERALVEAAGICAQVWRDHNALSVSSSDRQIGAAECERRIRALIANPPTDAAAAERAEIVAMLRESADGYEAAGLHPTALALRGAADRIAARGPGPVWTEARARAVAEAILRDPRTDEHALFCPAHDLSFHPGDCVADCMAQRVEAALDRVRAGT